MAHWLGSKTFAQQVLLGAAGVLMGLAVLFSMSRAGLFGMLAGITVLGCYLLSKSSLRRYTVSVFVIIALFVGLGASIGMTRVMAGVKDAASLKSLSWQGRLGLARSGLQAVCFSLGPLFASLLLQPDCPADQAAVLLFQSVEPSEGTAHAELLRYAGKGAGHKGVDGVVEELPPQTAQNELGQGLLGAV